jgi:carbonic anhydrase/acetyltransferase-like protein (isoleucine patch superfamily)
MPIHPFLHHQPQVHESCFIAPSADVIGRVTLHEMSSVWYNATLRGDINEIVIGPAIECAGQRGDSPRG